MVKQDCMRPPNGSYLFHQKGSNFAALKKNYPKPITALAGWLGRGPTHTTVINREPLRLNIIEQLW